MEEWKILYHIVGEYFQLTKLVLCVIFSQTKWATYFKRKRYFKEPQVLTNG